MKKEARPRRLLVPFGTAVALATFGSPLFAQFGPNRPPTVIRGGTVHVGNGDVFANGTVILRGREIEAVGVDLPVPEGANVVDATGKHVYPGLIDVESTLLLDPESRALGEGSLTNRVADALDLFDGDAMSAAWGGGVTTVGVVSRRSLFDGARAVVKLKRARGGDVFLREEGDFAVTFGGNVGRPSMRLREWKTFGEQLAATQKYIEAWDEYAEKLEEYKKELEKSAKEGTKLPADKKDEATPKPEAPGGAPGPGAGDGSGRRGPGGEGRRPRPGRVHTHDTPFLNWLRDTLGWMCDCGLPSDGGRHEAHDHHALTLTDGVSYAELVEEPAKPEGGEAKKEEPKKPGRPNREEPREALRKVLEGKAGVNVYYGGAADLQNLLDLLATYPLKVSVTGGGEAADLADQLAARGITVIVVQPHDLGSDDLGAAATLADAGVTVVLTTAGRSPEATRHLSLSAAAAVAGGLPSEEALAAITSRAATLLGVGDKVGSLEAGKHADVVITRGELFSSSAVIERVFVEGASVLQR